MLLPLNLNKKGSMYWPGVTSGVQVVRASSLEAEVSVSSRACGRGWRDAMGLVLGEGWRGMPSGSLDIAWEAQPGETVTLALTQQRGHPTGCWVESFLIAQQWLPESVTGPTDPVDPGGPGDPGEPMCPAGSFWAVRFEGISLCACVEDQTASKRVSAAIPNEWICMKEHVETDFAIIPNTLPPFPDWPVIHTYDGNVCGGAPVLTSTLAVELFAFGGKVGVIAYESPSGAPAIVFGSDLATAPAVGGEVVLPSTLASCVAGPGATIGHGGVAVVRRLR